MGGRSLERLAATGELGGVIDVTTHELADLVAGGVYSAGDGRLRGAGARGLPQVVVPGAIDHSNFWAAYVPKRYLDREFFRYNAQNILMRTDADEFEKLGVIIAERLNAAKGPVRVLIPFEGFSEHTKLRACGPCTATIVSLLTGRQAEEYRACSYTHLENRCLNPAIPVDVLPLHINDVRFADACADAFLQINDEAKLEP